MKIKTQSIGEKRAQVLPLPTGYTVSVSRDDGYAPSETEIFTVLEIARTSIKEKSKSKPKH